MAEIYCGTASKPEKETGGSTRAARRRRMEIRRFRLVSEVDGLAASAETEEEADGGGRKRRILHDGSSGILWAGRADAKVPHEDGSGDEAESDPGARCASEVPKGCAAKLAPEDRCCGFGMISVCGRRRDMEDAVAARPEFARGCHAAAGGHHFFGVYDGHGCSHVATSCRDRMHELVAEEMSKDGSGPPPAGDGGWWKSVMERSFTRMDAEAVVSDAGNTRSSPNCRCELQVPKCDHVGSTAVVAVVGPDRIVVANCGDSRAVLCRRKGAPLPLSDDHKPDRPDELRRIEDAGGRVIYWNGARVLGVLAMSRAIGDGYLKPYVTSEPEVTVTERSDDDECLILASDGLWDVVTNETACEIVRMCLQGGNTSPGTVSSDEPEDSASDDSEGKASSDAAILLTKLALARQSVDNVSVVVVDLRRRRRCR